MNETAYQTLIVKFSEPITVLDGIFDDAEAWGVDTLKGWIDSYESTRFTATDSHTAVITSRIQPGTGKIRFRDEIGRASCRERVYVLV